MSGDGLASRNRQDVLVVGQEEGAIEKRELQLPVLKHTAVLLTQDRE